MMSGTKKKTGIHKTKGMVMPKNMGIKRTGSGGGKNEVTAEKGSPFKVLAGLLAAYVVTVGLLFLLALLVYQFELPEGGVDVGICVIYVLSTFVSGFWAGKSVVRRRFLWGLFMGVCYFLVLMLVSFFVNKEFAEVGGRAFTVFVLCGAGGMLGGMVS